MNAAFFAMTIWLLSFSSSATSRVCLVLGCLVIAVVHSRPFQRHSGVLKASIPVCLCLYLVLAFGFNLNGQLAGAVGRDPTLHDRTKIWAILLSMHTNPLVGTGYETFWVGPRFEWFGRTSGLGSLNEAHNGYLEVYLNLGLVGLSLLALFLIASYRTIWRNLNSISSLGSFALALWTIIFFYSVTEVGFRSGLMWLTFLMGVITVRGQRKEHVYSIAAFDNTGPKQISSSAMEMTSQER